MMPQFDKETTAEQVCDAFSPRIKGRTFLITGTSARGLGAKIATTLASYSPARLILLARDKAKVDPVIEEIRSLDPDVDTRLVLCELSSQDSVRRAAGDILGDASIDKIDVVINNAAVMAVKEYTVDDRGNELQLSSNYIGHFLLTNLILPKILAAGPGARIVNHTSHGHRITPFRFEDPNFSGGKEYDPWSGYGQSKTANILFGVELARRLRAAAAGGRHAQSYSVHPGSILTTNLLGPGRDLDDFRADLPALEAATRRNTGEDWWLDPFFKTDSQGSASALVAALDPGVAGSSGAYVEDCAVGRAAAYAVDAGNAARLWAYSEEVVGQKFDLGL